MPKSQAFFSNQLPQHLDQTLQSIIAASDQTDIVSLKNDIRQHLRKVQAALAYNEFLDIETAHNIANVLLRLLNEITSYIPSHQVLVIGAAKYFIYEHDLQPDTESILGFDDDVKVLNHVLSKIGRVDLRIDI